MGDISTAALSSPQVDFRRRHRAVHPKSRTSCLKPSRTRSTATLQPRGTYSCWLSASMQHKTLQEFSHSSDSAKEEFHLVFQIDQQMLGSHTLLHKSRHTQDSSTP